MRREEAANADFREKFKFILQNMLETLYNDNTPQTAAQQTAIQQTAVRPSVKFSPNLSFAMPNISNTCSTAAFMTNKPSAVSNTLYYCSIFATGRLCVFEFDKEKNSLNVYE